MAYDSSIAQRIRELLAEEKGITERKMFGGLAFLVRGNMCVAASGQGGMLVRIDPADIKWALGRPNALRMKMGGRSMDGWIRVAPEGARTTREIGVWVKRSLAYVRTLPPK